MNFIRKHNPVILKNSRTNPGKSRCFFPFALMQSRQRSRLGALFNGKNLAQNPKIYSPSFFRKKKQKIPLSLHEPSTMYSNANSAKISILSFSPQQDTKTHTETSFHSL